MQIGIIGKGYVGSALGELLEIGHNVVYYDKYKECNDFNALNNCEVVFICVPTPMKISGEIDISAVEDSIKKCPNVPIIIKSTIPPGTTDLLKKKYSRELYFNPEFLRQDFSAEDMRSPQKLIATGDIVLEVFKGLIDCPIILTSNTTAEMMKYANNIILAGQIGLANEIYKICKVFNVDYEEVKSSMLIDKRIGRNLDVPGKDGFGFHGECFPKDLNALIYHSEENGHVPYLLKELWRSND